MPIVTVTCRRPIRNLLCQLFPLISIIADRSRFAAILKTCKARALPQRIRTVDSSLLFVSLVFLLPSPFQRTETILFSGALTFHNSDGAHSCNANGNACVVDASGHFVNILICLRGFFHYRCFRCTLDNNSLSPQPFYDLTGAG